MNLIKHCMECGLISYGAVLDWWLTDNKFNSWDSDDVGRFTKKIHKINSLSPNRDIHYGSAKNMKFPKKASRFPQFWIGKGSSEGRDIVRHIRNGIAHGNTKVRTINSQHIIEICDYQVDGKTQTAYILVPLDYLIIINGLYNDTEKCRKSNNKVRNTSKH